MTEPGVCWEPAHGGYWCECETDGETQACITEDREDGVAVCFVIDDDVITDSVFSECGPCGPADQQACADAEDGLQFCVAPEGFAHQPPARPPAFSWGPCLSPEQVECTPGEIVRCPEGPVDCQVGSDGVPYACEA